MKKLIFIFISLVFFLIAIRSVLPRNCTLESIRRDVPLQMFEAITRDGHQNPLLTRFFHNKVTFYSQNTLRCYLSYFDLSYLLEIISPFGVVFFLSGIFICLADWESMKRHRFLLITLFLAPLLPFVALSEWIAKLSLFGPISLTIYLGLSKISKIKDIKLGVLISIIGLISIIYLLK